MNGEALQQVEEIERDHAGYVSAAQWEYYSIRYYVSCEQWQPEGEQSPLFWNDLGAACEALSFARWQPFLLSDRVALFRREKIGRGRR